MSSGASVAYEKPRSGRSICIDETPRSSRIASALTSFAASCVSTIEKSPRRKRTSTPVGGLEVVEVRLHGRVAVDRDELARAVEVLGEQTGVPAGAEGRVDDRLAGLRRRGARGPRPRAPGCGQPRSWARRWATSLALPSTPFCCSVHASRLQTSRWSKTPAMTTSRPRPPASRSGWGTRTRPCLSMAVVLRPGEEEPAELAGLGSERIEVREPLLDEGIPACAGKDVDVGVEPLGDDDAVGEELAKPGRQGEPSLLVDRVLVGAVEHRPPVRSSTGVSSTGLSSIGVPVLPTEPHNRPLSPTLQHEWPTSSPVRRARTGPSRSGPQRPGPPERQEREGAAGVSGTACRARRRGRVRRRTIAKGRRSSVDRAPP